MSRLIDESEYEIEEKTQSFVDSFNESAAYNFVRDEEKFDYFVRYVGVCFALQQKTINKIIDKLGVVGNV